MCNWAEIKRQNYIVAISWPAVRLSAFFGLWLFARLPHLPISVAPPSPSYGHLFLVFIAVRLLLLEILAIVWTFVFVFFFLFFWPFFYFAARFGCPQNVRTREVEDRKPRGRRTPGWRWLLQFLVKLNSLVQCKSPGTESASKGLRVADSGGRRWMLQAALLIYDKWPGPGEGEGRRGGSWATGQRSSWLFPAGQQEWMNTWRHYEIAGLWFFSQITQNTGGWLNTLVRAISFCPGPRSYLSSPLPLAN